jgi:hypothetical protein
MQLTGRDRTNLIRSVSGLLFAVGALVLLERKSGHHHWGDFARLLVVLVPAAVLYLLALGMLDSSRSEEAEPWQSVLAVVAILLGPVALFQLLEWIGASTHHVLYDAGVFALTALLAGYAAKRAHAPYAALLAALSLLVTWLLLWSKILSHPSADTYRWLLVAAAALLLLGSARLMRIGAIGAGEVATAGGLTAVAAGVFGVIVGYFLSAFGPLINLSEGSNSVTSSRVFSSSSENASVNLASGPAHGHLGRIPHLTSGRLPKRTHLPTVSGLPHRVVAHQFHAGALPNLLHNSGVQHFGWDLYLLVVSLMLVWIGSRARVRGLGYVGGVGLLAFIVSVGSQITRIEAGRAPTSAIVGWPLTLIVLGVLGLAAPMLRRRKH